MLSILVSPEALALALARVNAQCPVSVTRDTWACERVSEARAPMGFYDELSERIERSNACVKHWAKHYKPHAIPGACVEPSVTLPQRHMGLLID